MDSLFFYSKPKCERKFASVADVQDQMTAFNLMYEVGPNGSVNNCGDENLGAQWRKAIREGVINCAGSPVEIDFFEKLAGGVTDDVDATNLYIKSNCDVNYNIYAAGDATGNAPGAPVAFTMHRSMHAGNGKFSNVTEGGSIYDYYYDQWLLVTEVDRTVDYAHVVTVRPYAGDYTVQIKKGKPMFFNSTRNVGGDSCPAPSTNWTTNGFIAKIMPFRHRKDFELKIELDRPYQEVLQFAIIFDANGKRVDSWEYKAMDDMRRDLKIRNNLDFWIGQKITNSAIIDGTTLDPKYPGYDGYQRTVKYGGGVNYEYAKSVGLSLNSDIQPILLRQDAKKKSMEFIALHGKPAMANLINRANKDFQAFTGACTFESFTRSGMNMDEIKKLGVKSYEYLGFTLHFKEMSALSDERFIGHGTFPYQFMLMPTNGLTDSNGRKVPPIEFFRPKGMMYEEYVRDMRKINGCEHIAGHAVQTNMMATHCVDSHILITPY